jgi:hypothetical protein
MQTNSISVTSDIKLSRVAGLLCSAFEGGSNYWYRIEDFKEPANPVSHFEDGDNTVYRHIDYPLCPDGAVIVADLLDRIEDEENEDGTAKYRTYVLDFEAVQRGLSLMPTKAAYQWGRFLSEDDDADTGDAFLQCCLFGEVRYG